MYRRENEDDDDRREDRQPQFSVIDTVRGAPKSIIAGRASKFGRTALFKPAYIDSALSYFTSDPPCNLTIH